MMEPKVIKTERQYNETLKRIEFLMDRESLGKRETDELELLGILASLYENEKWPIKYPTPLDAILFRMDQMGLSRTDMEKYLGGRSKVSEILSGKRSLSKQMIVTLHRELEIPLESLMAEQVVEEILPKAETEPDWMKFPVKEIIKRGWVQASKVKDEPEAYHLVMKNLALPAGADRIVPAMLRSSNNKKVDTYALAAWKYRVLGLAKSKKFEVQYQPDLVTSSFTQELAKLSYLDKGPLLAMEFLNKNGIHLIIETHLDHTYLDGASMLLTNGTPLIALTLRYDRLDNFWFVLFHELAHLVLHLSNDASGSFLEDLDIKSEDTEEREADKWAVDALINPEIWKTSGLNIESTYDDIINFARNLRISPSIPAGRLAKETGDFRKFSKLVGNGKVRSLFLQP